MVISKSRGVKSKFDISIELPTKTIKRLYYYIVNRFFISEVIIWSNILQIPIFYSVQELTSISLYKFGSWFGSSTVLAIIEILTISSLVEKQS